MIPLHLSPRYWQEKCEVLEFTDCTYPNNVCCPEYSAYCMTEYCWPLNIRTNPVGHRETILFWSVFWPSGDGHGRRTTQTLFYFYRLGLSMHKTQKSELCSHFKTGTFIQTPSVGKTCQLVLVRKASRIILKSFMLPFSGFRISLDKKLNSLGPDIWKVAGLLLSLGNGT